MRKPRHRVTKRQATVETHTRVRVSAPTPKTPHVKSPKCKLGCMPGYRVDALCELHNSPASTSPDAISYPTKRGTGVGEVVEILAADKPHAMHPYAGGGRKTKAARMGNFRKKSSCASKAA